MLKQIIKGIFASNTMQFNSVLAAVWTAFLNSEYIQSNPEYAALLAAFQTIGNFLLRLKTKTAIIDRATPKEPPQLF